MASGVAEIARMVVRLIGDTASYAASMGKAATSTTNIGTQVAKVNKQLQSLNKTMVSAASSITGLMASFGLTQTLQGALDKFTQMEEAIIGLDSAIKVNGKNVETTRAAYEDYIGTVTQSTLITRLQALSILEAAEAQGFSGKKAQESATIAIALAKGNGELAQSYVKVAVMMQRGHIEIAKRMLGLQGVMSRSKMLELVHHKLAAGLEIAKLKMESVSGQIQKLSRSFLSLNVEIGEIVAKAIGPLVNWIAGLMDSFTKLDPQVKKVIVYVVAAAMAFIALGPTIVLIGVFFAPVIAFVKALAAAFLSLLSPTGLLIVGLIATAGALADIAGIDATSMWAKAKTAVLSLWEATKGFMSNFIANMKILFAWLSEQWNRLYPVVVGFWEGLKDIAKAAIGVVVEIVATLVQSIGGVWDDVVDGTKTAWETALGYVRSFVSFSLGFLANFRVNVNIIMDWVRNNWKNVWNDVVVLAKMAYNGMGNAFKIGLETLARLLTIFSVWISDKLFNMFGVDFHKIVTDAMAAAGLKIIEWGKVISKVISDALLGKRTARKDTAAKSFIERFNKDAKDAKKSKSFQELVDLAEEIIGEQAGKFKDPFAEFKKTIGDMPEFDLRVGGVDMPKFIFDQAQKSAKEAGEGGLKIGRRLMGGLEKALGKFDAAEFFSADAITRIQEQMDKLQWAQSRNTEFLGKGVGKFDAAEFGSAEAIGRGENQASILKQILEVLKKTEGKPGLPVVPVGL